MTNSLFIGVDVALKTNQFCVMNFDQHIFFNLKFPNTPDGSEQFVSKLRSIYEKFHFDKLVFCLEATGVYSFHIACFLSSNQYLNSFNSVVYQVNAKDIKNYKKSFSDLEKTDPIDSYTIADFARVGRCKNLHPFRGSQYIALQRLTRQRFHLVKNLVKEKIYVMNNLYLSFSGLVFADKSDKPFSDMFGATSMALLEEFTSPDVIANTSLENMLNFISLKGKNRSKNPNDKINLLNKAIRSSYRLEQTAYDPINIAIASSINLIKTFDAQIKDIDKAIVKTVYGLDSNAYNVLLSIPGIGRVFAAGILAEIGSIDYYKHNSNLAKYIGLSWNRNQSGNFDSDNRKISSCANKYLRYYIVEATSSCNRHKFSFIRDYYVRKYDEVKKNQHKRALVLSARKFVRLVFGLLHKNQYYVPINSDHISKIC